MADGELDLTFFNGAVRNSENEHIAKLLRQKSKLLVAFGSCAHMGGHPGAREPDRPRTRSSTAPTCTTRRSRRATRRCRSRRRTVDGGELEIPDLLQAGLQARRRRGRRLLPPRLPAGARPGQGGGRWWRCQRPGRAAAQGRRRRRLRAAPSATTASGRSEEKKVTQFYRPWQIIQDPETLPARAGDPLRRHRPRAPAAACAAPTATCRAAAATARCPTSIDQGAKFVSAVASIIDSKDPEEIEQILAGHPGHRRHTPTASACRPRCCRGALRHDPNNQHRPDHPARRATARSRSSSTTTGAVKDCYFQIPELRGFERFVVGPADRGAAAHRDPHLRRLPGQPPHGQRQGGRRLLRRRVPGAGPQAARHVLQRALHPQPHRPLLRAGRARLRLRPRRRPRDAQHPRRGRQGRARDRRRGHQGARAWRRRSSRSSAGASPTSSGACRAACPRGSMEELAEIRPMVDRALRLHAVLAPALPRRRARQRGLRRPHPQRPVHARRAQHGPGRREQRPQLLRRQGARRRLRGQGDLQVRAQRVHERTSPSTSSRGPTSSSRTSSSAAGRASSRASTRASTAPPRCRGSTSPTAWPPPRRRRPTRRCSRPSAASPCKALLAQHWARLVEMVQNAETLQKYCDDPEITGDELPRRPASRSPARASASSRRCAAP